MADIRLLRIIRMTPGPALALDKMVRVAPHKRNKGTNPEKRGTDHVQQ